MASGSLLEALNLETILNSVYFCSSFEASRDSITIGKKQQEKFVKYQFQFFLITIKIA